LLFFSSCSYNPDITQISDEKLADYNPKHFKMRTDASQRKRVENEDSMIMQAIFYEQRGDFQKSNYFYSKLYDKTGNDEYMFREMRTALYLGKKSKNIVKLESWVKENPENIQAKRILISFYLNEKKYDKAKVLSKLLISQSNNPVDFELASNPHIMTEEYKEAVSLLTQAYNKTMNAEILLKISTLLANYIGDVDEAVVRLERHRVSVSCDERVCLQLAEIYSKQEKIDKLLTIYQTLYKKTKKSGYGVKVVEGYIYKKEPDKAIEFLQKDYVNNELLYELYLSKKDYFKAQKVAQKNYESGKNAKWLAESAMALYEQAENKNDKNMLLELVNKFDKAISEGVRDAVYLNYYGYTLIDKEMDIEKGIKLVKEALLTDDNNTYYLDSLAWGYYKQNRCEKARIAMKKVVDIEGLDEDDILDHWTKIKACK
jgi:tetratricopeptide (TPR) repeat protein